MEVKEGALVLKTLSSGNASGLGKENDPDKDCTLLFTHTRTKNYVEQI